MNGKFPALTYAMVLGASIGCWSGFLGGCLSGFSDTAAAATAVPVRAPPPRPVMRAPVARPMAVRPNVPGKPGAAGPAGAKLQNGPGGAAGAGNGAAARAGGAAADPRSQLMEMVHPGAAAAKPLPNMHGPEASAHGPSVHGPEATLHGPAANIHAAPTRAAFTRPQNIRHNPEHRVGAVGGLHKHAPFMHARDGHRFYRRYYLEGGVWFWYDEPAPDDPALADGDLPTCDPNADECQGDVVPLAGPPPNPAYAPTDPAPGQ
jgi:hypothetical protein